MYTLDYKALFMIGFFVFLKALGIYLLITIPALVVLPEMYLISAGYAVSFGWIALAIFLPLFALALQTQQRKGLKKAILYGAVLLAVLIAFQMMQITGVEDHIWREPIFLLFPASAVVAGWISIALSFKKINSMLAFQN